jgi:hypothetical protein
MSAPEQAGTTAPDLEAPNPPLRVRRVLFFAVLGLLLAIVVPALIIVLPGDDPADPAIESRDDPIADLLAWIPANEQSRRAFAAWTIDPDLATQTPQTIAVDMIDRLSLEPSPRVLGRTPSWTDRFGWIAGQVSGWATAGRGSDLTILQGEFNEDLIVDRLLAHGYSRSGHRGAELFVLNETATPTSVINGDSAGAANAVALLNGRLIVAASPDSIRSAIDVAVMGEGSLADEPAIGAMLRSMAPLSAVVGVDQADHAASCDPNAIAPTIDGPGLSNYVIVGYGRFGPGEMRRTLVAASYPDTAQASAALAEFESGWISGFANAGGMGGSLDAFGRLSIVSQTENLLIAEIVDGRDEGWVRSGIRYAIPVCEAAMALAPPATPVPSGNQAGMPMMERIAASLPDTGPAGLFRAVDFRAIGTVRAISAPGTSPTLEEIERWRSSVGPLPPFSVLPSAPAALERWTRQLGISLSQIESVGEAQASSGQEPVGVLIGAWRLADLTTTLAGLGYEWTDIGDERHFAVSAGRAADDSLLAAAGAAWSNIAIAGDRMWVSADQRQLRLAVSEAIGESPPAGDANPLRATVLGISPGVTALEIAGAEYAAGRCSVVLPGILAVAATWSTTASGDEPALLYLPDGAIPATDLATELDGKVASMTLAVDLEGSSGPGTEVPVSTVPLSEILRYLGTERVTSTAGPAIVARFTALDRERFADAAFFEGTSGDCRLATAQ